MHEYEERKENICIRGWSDKLHTGNGQKIRICIGWRKKYINILFLLINVQKENRTEQMDNSESIIALQYLVVGLTAAVVSTRVVSTWRYLKRGGIYPDARGPLYSQ